MEPLSLAAATLISSGVSAGASLLGNGMNMLQNSQNVKNQKKLMDYQNEIYLRNLQEDRIFNSPENTMARYKAAGLNPNLIYGNGTEAAVGYAPNASAPSQIPMDFSGMESLVKDYIDAKEAESRIEVNNALSAKYRGEESRNSDLHEHIIESKEIQNAAGRIGLSSDSLRLFVDYATAQGRINKVYQDNAIAMQEAIISMADYFDRHEDYLKKWDLQDKNYRQLVRMNNQKIKESNAQIEKINQEIEESKARVDKIKSDKQYTDKQKEALINFEKRQQDKHGHEVKKLTFEANKMQWESEMASWIAQHPSRVYPFRMPFKVSGGFKGFNFGFEGK